MKTFGKLFIVSAPSGAGKTTLVTKLLHSVGEQYAIKRVVTYTTKTPRADECNGIDYHFISKEEFQGKIQHGFFLEYSTAYEYYYGTPADVINQLEHGHSWVLIVDRIGAQQIMNTYKDAVLIWIYTKNIDILAQRLIKRATENEDQVQKRLKIAYNEIQQECEQNVYHYHVLNDDLIAAAATLQEIVIKELTIKNVANERANLSHIY